MYFQLFVITGVHTSKVLSILANQVDDWDKRSIRSIRSVVSQNVPGGSIGELTLSASNETGANQNTSHDNKEKEIERLKRFW